MNEEILWGLIRDCERASHLLGLDRPVTARVLIDSVVERLWDTLLAPKSLAFSGAEGGATDCRPVVMQTELANEVIEALRDEDEPAP